MTISVSSFSPIQRSMSESSLTWTFDLSACGAQAGVHLFSGILRENNLALMGMNPAPTRPKEKPKQFKMKTGVFVQTLISIFIDNLFHLYIIFHF